MRVHPLLAWREIDVWRYVAREGIPVVGLYAAARAGRLPDFTGVGAPYEPPAAPGLVLATEEAGIDEMAGRLAAYVAGAVALPGLAPHAAGVG